MTSTGTARRLAMAAAATTAAVAPLLLGAAGWPFWWREIAPEQTAMTWLQSVVLVVAGFAAVLAAVVDVPTARRWWLVLAAAFVVLTVDERFALHERLRDGYLAPRGIAIPFLPWVAPGDFILLTVGAVGLALLPRIRALLRRDVTASRALLLGVLLAAVAVGVDSVDPAAWTLGQERVQQSLEECVELASGLSLLTAIVLRLLGLLPSGDAREPAPPVPAATGNAVL